MLELCPEVKRPTTSSSFSSCRDYLWSSGTCLERIRTTTRLALLAKADKLWGCQQHHQQGSIAVVPVIIADTLDEEEEDTIAAVCNSGPPANSWAN
jgi:hypothetical protein